MALAGSPDVGFVLLEGRRIDNITTSMKHKYSQILDETTALGDADKAYTPVRQYLWEASIEGFYNTGTGLAQEGLELTGNQVLMYSLFGNAIGDEFVGVDGPHGKITTMMERGKLHRIQADFKASISAAGDLTGPVTRAQDVYTAGVPTYESRGMVQTPLSTVTDVGPTNLTTLDWGAGNYTDQEIGEAVGFLGISDIDVDGAGNFLVEIQDSANDIAYANLIVFAVALTDGITGQRVDVAAAVAPNDIERYTQTQYEFQGVSGASRTATFAVGLARRYIVI